MRKRVKGSNGNPGRLTLIDVKIPYSNVQLVAPGTQTVTRVLKHYFQVPGSTPEELVYAKARSLHYTCQKNENPLAKRVFWMTARGPFGFRHVDCCVWKDSRIIHTVQTVSSPLVTYPRSPARSHFVD